MEIDYMAYPGCARALKNTCNDSKDEVFNRVCKNYSLTPEEVLESNKIRLRDYVIVRQITMTLFRLKLGTSLRLAGEYFGKDHATVLHSIKTVKNLNETDREFREKSNDLLKGINFPEFKN